MSPHLFPVRLAVVFLFALGLAVRAPATDFWTGAGGNDNWSTPGNWQDGTVPANPDSTTIYFTQADAGNTNVVDHDWNIRYLVYSNQFSRHTLDLGGNKLVAQGSLIAGRDTTNCGVTIQNGTLQLGTGTMSCVIYVGNKTISYLGITNNSLTISCTVAVSNANNIQVGYGTPTDANGVSGLLDLSGATISTRDIPNVLIVSNVYVSFRSTNPSVLKLPPSLTVFEVNGLLALGYYGFNPGPSGTLDFGDHSSLTNFRVRGDFLMGDYSSTGILTNLPSQVHLEIGLPNAPKKMYISNHTGRQATGTEAKLKLSQGRLTAYLSELFVGAAHTEGEGTSTGLLDLASSSVQIGAEPNKIRGVDTFKICHGQSAYGLLRLPSNITEISVGAFIFGRGSRFRAAGGSEYEARGYLDIGSNSALRSITATNGFYWSTENGNAHLGYTDDAGQFIEYTPTGLTLTVGGPSAPVPFHVAGGGTYYWAPCTTGTLVLAQATVFAWLTDLCVGFTSDSAALHKYGFPQGLLDLSQATLVSNGATNTVQADRLIVGGAMQPGSAGGNGKLLLSPAITNVNVGQVQVGCGGNINATGGDGWLDFGTGSQLKNITVSRDFWMGAYNGATGRLVNLPTSNWTFTVGSPSSRGSIVLGHHDTLDYGKKGVGDFSPTGATFQAWLTNLWIGASVNTNVQGGTWGRLDLSACILSNLDVDGSVVVGMGSNTYSGSKNLGRLILPAGAVTAGRLQVGNLNTTNTYGLVELDGTRFAITSQCAILSSGAVTSHIAGVSAGLDIRSTHDSALAISGLGRLHLDFTADPLDVGAAAWGLRWAGDHRSALESMTNSKAITWNTTALSSPFLKRFGIHYDQKDTFIGIRRSQTFGALILVY